MSAITDKNLNNTFVQNLPSRDPLFWTDVKVQRAWELTFSMAFAVGAIAGSALSIAVCPAFLVIAVPSVLAAIAFAWHASTLIDYDNPSELAKVREQSKMMPLSQVASKHGWEKIFRYQILSTEDLKTKFDIEWKPRPASLIAEQFGKYLHYLLSYRLVSQREHSLLNQADTSIRKCNRSIEQVRNEYANGVRHYDTMYSVGNNYLWSRQLDHINSSSSWAEINKERRNAQVLNGIGNLAYDAVAKPHREKLKRKADEFVRIRDVELEQIDRAYNWLRSI